MSLEATWDLRSRTVAGLESPSFSGLSYTPTSVCIFPAPVDSNSSNNSTNKTSNPFDDSNPPSSSSSNRPTPQAIVFGSEEGSLHYRSYPSLEEDASEVSSSIASSSKGSMSSFGSPSRRGHSHMSNANAVASARPALGVTPSGRTPSNIPRIYLPVDLPSKSLKGPVVDVIPAVVTTQRKNEQRSGHPSSLVGLFLVLVDDNKGSNKQGGAYAATMVSLHNGAFTKISRNSGANGNKLPERLSCATYHEDSGFVVCSGKRILSVPTAPYLEEAASGDASKSSGSSALSRMVGGGGSKLPKHITSTNLQQTTMIDFSGSILPPPGARGGPNSLIVVAHGHLAIVAVGNAVYAVPGVEVGLTPPGTPVSPSSSPDTTYTSTKIFSFGQSSQIHPILINEINDRSIPDDWSALLLCNGREAAVVDVHWDAMECSASAGPPRSTSSTASPILAAASSWPFCLFLTSDGLVSVRATSSLAVSLKTVEVGTRPNDFFSLRSFGESSLLAGNSGRHYFYPESSQKKHKNYYHDDDYSAPESAHNFPWVVSLSHSGQAKIMKCHADTRQDLADRLMRISIDAFGSGGFPRSQLAEALQCSFTATSYAGPEPNQTSRTLLKEYLESILGLAEFESGSAPGWPVEERNSQMNRGSGFGTSSLSMSSSGGYNPFPQQQQAPNENNKAEFSAVVNASDPNALLTGTALLCLCCAQLSPSPKGSLANRAAKKCALQMGVIVLDEDGTDTKHGIATASIRLNEMVATRLLKEAASNHHSLLSGSASTSTTKATAKASLHMEFVEASVWLLRSCGRHEQAIDVLRERLRQHKSPESSKQPVGFWSPLKYESYTASHLSELWGTQIEAACRLVLRSPATVRLLETNPQLGLSIFTVNHPQNANQWRTMADHDDPLVAHPKHPSQVVRLLKNIQPVVAYNSRQKNANFSSNSNDDNGPDDEFDSAGNGTKSLPLQSGRALAISFLESAVGLSTNRPETDEFDLLDKSMEYTNNYAEDLIADFHDELCFLLLEGVISEKNKGDTNRRQQIVNPQQSDDLPVNNSSSFDNNDGDFTPLGCLYREKLRRFLRWPLAKIRSERLLEALPRSFLQEKALVLGRLGRHDEALKILYCNCKSMNLALEYCDMLHARRRIKIEFERARLAAESMLDDRANDELDEKFQKQNAYLPLVQVALESDPDKQRGITSAIQILALRKADIDRSAALRLLPDNLPVSALARPFLIPALVESESQARRLKVVSSLLRAKHTALQHQLTDAQLKAQANLYVVPQFKSMNLGEPLHSTKPMKARPSASSSATFPEMMIVKHFFPRHLIIQAKITNNSNAVDGRALGNLAFVVAESSEDAVQPNFQVPVPVLPFGVTGCAWCVLVVAPHRMEGSATLTCELRYTVLGDGGFGNGHHPPSSLLAAAPNSGRTYVEELQDMEVFASHFS